MVATLTLPPQQVHRYRPMGAAEQLFYCRDNEVMLDGPAGCVAGETRLLDPTTGEERSIADLYRAGDAPMVLTLLGPVQATMPFRKGLARLYRVTTRSGRSFVGTSNHRVLTPSGWMFVAHVAVGDRILVGAPDLEARDSLAYPSGFPQDDGRFRESIRGSQERYDPSLHRGGERLLPESGSGQSSIPSRVDAHGRSRAELHWDDPVGESGCTHAYPSCGRPSTQGCSSQFAGTVHTESHDVLCTLSADGDWSQSAWPSRTSTTLQRPIGERERLAGNTGCALEHPSIPALAPLGNVGLAEASPQPHALSPWSSWFERTSPGSLLSVPPLDACSLSSNTSKCNYTAQWDTVQAIEYERTDEYFDLHVPGAEHYLAEGIWHHNTGKSLGALQKIHRNAIKYPTCRQLIVRKTRASLTQTAMVTFEQKVLKGGPVRFHSTQQEYQYPNGSVIVVGGLDKDSKVMSSEYDTIYVQEATELLESDWEALTTRLRNGVIPHQQLMGDCNPGPPTHWINRRCTSGRTTRILSRHTDNPALWDGTNWTPYGVEYISRLDALTGVRRLRLRLGMWAAAEGQVYEEWDAKAHLIDSFPIPKEWPRYIVVDFGYTNPFVCQWWAEDPDGRLYLYREIYMTQRIVEDHAKQAVELHTKGKEPKPTRVIRDHDAEDGKTFEKHTGWKTQGAMKEVNAGINAVKARLKLAGDGRPRLFVFRDALVELDQSLRDAGKPTCTAEEYETYVWDTRTAAAAKEHPVKENDHGMDTTRYLVRTLDGKPAPPKVGAVAMPQTSTWGR